MWNRNCEEKRGFVRNWQLIVGLSVFSITNILKHTVGLHDFFLGFGEGLGIVLIFIGMLAASGRSVCKLIKRRGKPADNMQ